MDFAILPNAEAIASPAMILANSVACSKRVFTSILPSSATFIPALPFTIPAVDCVAVFTLKAPLLSTSVVTPSGMTVPGVLAVALLVPLADICQ